MARDDGITSFDDDDDDGPSTSFGKGPVSRGERSPGSHAPGDRRKRSRKGIATSPGMKGKPLKRSIGPVRLDIRSIRAAAGSMLTISVAGVLFCAGILYFTFIQPSLPQFYGALAAAMVVMLLLGYIGARLLGVEE